MIKTATPDRATATPLNDMDAAGQTERERERAQIDRLASVMHCRFTRDDCADYVIQGQSGNIHIDGAGYSVAVMLETKMQWTYALRALHKFCELRQRGDTEGVLHMAGLPTPAQAEALREALGVKKRRECSDETLERLRNMGFKPAIKGELGAPEREILAAG